jgi:hypothetical protein
MTAHSHISVELNCERLEWIDMEMKGFVSLHKTNLDVERRVYDKKGVL